MKRVLLILFGLATALTFVGLMVAFSRPIKWPGNIASPQWRRAVGDGVELEEVGA